MSSSVGARPSYKDEDWDDAEDMVGKFEEDLLPGSLSDLLTPQEKMRRFSRDQGEGEGTSFSNQPSMSRLGASPTTSDMRFGSPSGVASSPSRFQSLWGKSQPTSNGFESGSPGASAFGHVGSPLRNSSLHPGASPSLRALNRPTSGDSNSFLSSPPRHTSMNMLSQHMSRTRLSSREEAGYSGNPIHHGINRVTSGSSVGSSGGRLGMDRAVSSSSINRERIEEEQGLFSMEEEEDLAKGRDGASTTSSTSNKRLSGLSWGSGGGKASPNLAPVGGHRATGSSGLGRETGPWGSNAWNDWSNDTTRHDMTSTSFSTKFLAQKSTAAYGLAALASWDLPLILSPHMRHAIFTNHIQIRIHTKSCFFLSASVSYSSGHGLGACGFALLSNDTSPQRVWQHVEPFLLPIYSSLGDPDWVFTHFP
jgi:hypothetical protein